MLVKIDGVSPAQQQLADEIDHLVAARMEDLMLTADEVREVLEKYSQYYSHNAA